MSRDEYESAFTDDDLDVVMRARCLYNRVEFVRAILYGPDGETWHIDCPNELERITGIHPGAFWDLGGAR